MTRLTIDSARELRWAVDGWTPAAAQAALRALELEAFGATGVPLFAEIEHDADGALHWQVPGSVAHGFYELDEQSRANLRARIGRRIGQLRRTLDARARRGDRDAPRLAALVRHALEIPGWNAVFAVSGEPVLAGWGHVSAAQDRPVALLAGLDDGIALPARLRSPWAAWLASAAALALLLLGGLAMAAWAPLGWLPVAIDTPRCQVSSADLGMIDGVDRQREAIDDLQRQLADTMRAVDQKSLACPVRVVELPPPAPIPPKAPPPEPPKQQAAAPPPKPPAKKPGEGNCIAEKRPEDPPAAIMVFDTSRSMGLPSGMTNDEALALERRANRGDQQAIRQMMAALNQPGRKRIDDARESAARMMQQIHPKIRTGMVTFANCRGNLVVPPGGPEARNAIQGQLQYVRPDAATPIAAGITAAVQSLPPGQPDREDTIIVVTDGQESCGGDPCAAAAAAKAQRPSLKIHVIDVTNSANLQCVAAITGGRVIPVNNPSELDAAMAQATREIRRDACK